MPDARTLDGAVLRAALFEHYRVSAIEIVPLELGNDAASFVYRVVGDDGAARFLKLRSAAGFSRASLELPAFLCENGLPNVAAPLRTVAGDLSVPLEGHFASLYPYLDASSAARAGLSRQQWRELGAAVRKIHSVGLSDRLLRMLPREEYVPSRRPLLDDLDRVIAELRASDQVASAWGEAWDALGRRVHTLVERADRLAERLRGAALPTVTCHADLHPWNVLVEESGSLWILDWDEAALAPRERDLMFVIGGIGHGLVSEEATACFLDGYGRYVIDVEALAYYRHARALEDVAAYAETALLTPGLDERSRRRALAGFVDLFATGNIFDIAEAGDLL